MATWDGSYPELEAPNYYMYSNLNVLTPCTPLFPNNGGTLQSNSNFYAQNESAFEQNCPPAFYQMESYIPPNIVPPHNDFAEHLVPNDLSNIPSLNTLKPSDQNDTSRDAPTFTKHKGDNRDGKTRYHRIEGRACSSRGEDKAHSSIAEHSNLHATATEFIPNGMRYKKDRVSPRESHNRTLTNESYSRIENYASRYKSSNAFSPDESNRYEKKYSGKKTVIYKQRSQQTNIHTGNGYKNYYGAQRGRNCGKSQNGSFSHTKRNIDNHADKISSMNNEALLHEAAALSIASDDNIHTFTANDDNAAPEGTAQSSSIVSRNRRTVHSNKHEGSNAFGDNTRLNSKMRGNYNCNGESAYRDSGIVPRPREGIFKNIRRNPNMKYNKYDNNYKEKRYFDHDNNKFKGSNAKEGKIDDRKSNDRQKHRASESKDIDEENWRRKDIKEDRSTIPKRSSNKNYEFDNEATQRERLTEQLNRGLLECLVCCEYIKQTDYIWSCSNCYHVLHLKCVKKWAKSSQGDNGWRCPACQNVSTSIPEDYLCFCGKATMPEWSRRDIAHSCGEVCGCALSKNNCVHKCTLLCHPGSCPPCMAMVTKYCGCGKTSQTLQCSIQKLLVCDSTCGKELNCGKHTCEKKCHHGECGPCDNAVPQECHCGKNTRTVTCEKNVPLVYSCPEICGKMLNCKNHNCKRLCHEDACEPCLLTPDRIDSCCCGQSPLTKKRSNCLDPIPTCDKICSKRLRCGPPGDPHTCKTICHVEACPDCDLTTVVKCRCGNMDREMTCKDLICSAGDARCEIKCKVKRSCGKHKCNRQCCIDIEHICPLPCTKTLSCGKHKCEQSCHKGRCQTCWRSNFYELYCECGAEVIYPPVPCGTRKPTCNKPCSREHACGHEVLHNCHSEPTCPPCTVLTQRWCYGKHELRKAVPCYISEISCGLPCSKPLSCGRHKCLTKCHSGVCEKTRHRCTQPCTTPREICGHICAAPCHDDKCPDTPCKEMVKVTCQCGHRTMSRACAENSREYQRIASSILASKMADMQLGHSIDLEEVFGQGAKKQNQLKTLECNDECKLIERNRRLALGLQIANPDLTAKLMPRYSSLMKHWAKKNPQFCQMVHDKLTELVQLAKTSKQKSRSYSFDSMNREKRHFVHEACEHFGCESQAYDPEPNRNIVATAVRDKCWLPSYSLLEVVQRENGQRKVPGPMLNTTMSNDSTKTVLPLTPQRNSKTFSGPSSSKVEEPQIDYFDYQG